MKFYLVRHAEKAEGDYFNPRLRHDDQPISTFGRKQASKIKKYFHKHSIKSIYVSEYIRTVQTARPLARKLKIVPIADYRLNEIDIGIIDKLSDDEMREKYPEVWNAFQDRNSDFRWPEGETGLEAQERIVSFINEQINQEGIILIVAHDGIIRILICYVLGLPVYSRFNFQVDIASITEIEWDKTKNRWRLIRFNQSVA
jgi:broad specificity phosphatase PhoE